MNSVFVQKGFTLIEAVIYVLLFALLIGGTVGAVYNIMEFNNVSHARDMMYEEGNFLIAKIGWVASEAQSVNSPLSGSPGSSLSVNKLDNPLDTIRVELVDNNMVVTENSISQILNNDNVAVSNLVFSYQNTSNYQSVNIKFTLSSKVNNGTTISNDFETTKYLRN